MPLHTSLLVNTLGMLFIVPIIPLIGLMADKYGRKPTLMIGSLGILILSYPLFLLLNYSNFSMALLLQVLAALLVCFVSIPMTVTLIELVPTQIRYSAMGLSYNLANALFGGTAPMVVTFLIEKTGNILSPSFYLIVGSLILILVTLSIKETYKQSLS